jgi:hypothetical protein
MNPAQESGLLICCRARGPENDRPPEKRKVDSSILSLTTTDRTASSLRYLRFACSGYVFVTILA